MDDFFYSSKITNTMSDIIPYRNQNYKKLKSLHSKNNPFEDPEFPAIDSSIFYSKRVPSSVTWQRPHEFCSSPQFIVNEASRFDLNQGSIGNCWFVAAVSMITQNEELFEKVVPIDQSFQNDDYAGIFHFRFWQFGKWYDVVIDDRLPIDQSGKLIFCHNKGENNEFWAALLEKAYAKLSWSYEGLEAGQTTDALIDMTGGIEETFDLKEVRAKDSFWETLKNALKHDAMIGCSITPDTAIREAKLANGLVRGHAYAVTGAVTINVQGQIVRLIRCRNPWGNEVEWNGAWSDNDDRWRSIDETTRAQMGVKSQMDGEFWITLEDWLREFEHVQICNLPPDSYNGQMGIMLKKSASAWRSQLFDGVWVRGRTAGGCGQGLQASKYWTNPQYLVEIKAAKDHRSSDTYMMIIACIQKYTRQKRMQNRGRPAEEYIQIRVYQVNDPSVIPMVQSNPSDLHLFPKHLNRLATSGPYINKREVTCRLNVPPGFYLIIPSTYEANREGKFLIRIFVETDIVGRSIGEASTPSSQIYEWQTIRQYPRKISVVVLNQENTIDENEEPSEMYRYLDGMGVDPKYEIRQWWEALPEDEKQRVIKMAVPALGICCLLMLCRDFTRKIKGQPSNIEDFE